MNSLNGKIALVTGVAAKRSMGHTIALRLASEGAKLVIVDKYAIPPTIEPEDQGWGGLNAVASEIKSIGKEALAITADITNGKEVDLAVSKAVESFGGIDILVHCAALRGPVKTPVVDLSEEEWKKIVDINLNGSFLVAKAVAKDMVARGKGGKMLLIASMGAVKAMPGSAAYCASKFGVIGLVKSLALELVKNKIYVNAINPGSVATNLRDSFHQETAKAEGITIEQAREKDYQNINTVIPLGRLATAEEIANLVLFLVSDLSDYITGEAINISGGIN
jgi:NAD(P)-dependent dehydrogenase (short-subunit alcohol dehydrogenase family)